MSFHARWDPTVEAEGPVRQVWDVEPGPGGVTKLSVTRSPSTRAAFPAKRLFAPTKPATKGVAGW
jgi:hypothetical protein